MSIISLNRQLGLTESQKDPMKALLKMFTTPKPPVKAPTVQAAQVKALIVHYTNAQDMMKKKVCFDQSQVNRVYTYGTVQHITTETGAPIGLLDADNYFTAWRAV